MRRVGVLAAVFFLMTSSVLFAIAQERSNTASVPGVAARAAAATHGSASPATGTADDSQERVVRIEGEKRFRTNCGRCHMAPHKFPPRVMATAIRHMRVRAGITDEDMRLILGYMTQ